MSKEITINIIKNYQNQSIFTEVMREQKIHCRIDNLLFFWSRLKRKEMQRNINVVSNSFNLMFYLSESSHGNMELSAFRTMFSHFFNQQWINHITVSEGKNNLFITYWFILKNQRSWIKALQFNCQNNYMLHRYMKKM